MHALNAPRSGDPRLGLSLLFAGAALVMAVTNPPMVEFEAPSFASAQPPVVDRIMEWRPHGPPPGVDVDQFTPDEVEEAPITAAAAAEDDVASGRGDARARPEL